MKPVIIAHRGASALARHENSLEAFQIAIDLGSDYVEFDIRKTKDNKLIVFHDAAYNGRLISSLSYDEFCNIASKDHLKPPLLSEVLKLCQGHIKLDIEIKESGYEEDILREVLKYFSYEDFIIKSFFDNCLQTFKDIDSKVSVGLLVGSRSKSIFKLLRSFYPGKRLKRLDADFVSPSKRLIAGTFLFRMSQLHIDTYVWTVNDAPTMKKLFQKGVGGIITDRPDIAIDVRNTIFNK